jgi:Putative DNA-binding domain
MAACVCWDLYGASRRLLSRSGPKDAFRAIIHVSPIRVQFVQRRPVPQVIVWRSGLDTSCRPAMCRGCLYARSMIFTALHRAVGAAPGPLTDELLDAAVAAGVAETDDLDWKSEMPPARGLPQTDFPKDVAAMANSGGGVVIYGVRECQKAAIERVDVGEFDEAYERSMRSAAITAITPPVFGLSMHRLGDAGKRALVVEIPASVDGPHLIYKNEY